MKKLIVALLVSVSALMADGLMFGGEVGYAKVNYDLDTNVGSYSDDTYSKSIALKAGLKQGNIRLLGYLSYEKYSDDTVVYGEGRLLSYGAEVDYVFNGAYAGLIVGTGTKDFDGTDIDFNDYGVKLAAINELKDMSLEFGVQYKVREYDTYQYGLLTLDLKDEVIGLFVGINFYL